MAILSIFTCFRSLGLPCDWLRTAALSIKAWFLYYYLAVMLKTGESKERDLLGAKLISKLKCTCLFQPAARSSSSIHIEPAKENRKQ